MGDVGDLLRTKTRITKTILNQHNKAKNDVIAQMKDAVDQFTNATLNRSNVEDDLFSILTNTSKDTEDFIKSQFKAVDKILMDEG